MSMDKDQDTMIEIPKRRRRKFCCDLTLKECIECGSSLLLPLMLGVFTIVITLHQTNVAGQQRIEDRQIAKDERQQDLNISAQQRLDDRKQAEEQRQLDKKISQDQFKLNEEQRQHEVNIAYMQYRDNLLIDYIKDIGVLLKENNGSLTNDYVTRTIVRAKTLAIIRQLDPIRNVELIRFLYEAGQLTRNRNPLDLSTAQLQNIDFRNALYWNMPGLSLVGTHLFNASFDHNTLVDIDFRRSNLTGVNFTMASLRSCTFDNALLEKTIFTNSIMCKVSFKDAKLIDTNFINATVKEADFSGTELPYTNFSNAHLRRVFTGTSFNGTRFLNTTMRNSNCTDIDLTSGQFIDSSFDNTIFSNATADYATFTRCKMSSVDLTGARLKNTWFSYTNLQNANFIDVNVNGINFSHTDLFNAKIIDIQLLNAISIRGSRLPNGTYIDQDYNLITNGYADCHIPLESSWNIDENNSVAIIRSKQDENNCVFTPNKAIGPVRFYQKISDKYKQVRWELNPVLVLNARLGGQMTTITIGYPGHTYTMNSNHIEPIRFPLNKSMIKETITVVVTFNPLKDDLTSNWCDDIQITIELADQPE
ncbi:unnamed protein product [Adineta steineri]|uniref:Pentapeptide repeat-containing protein n=1 Tax=Adineta steineri TaxID=433720 RepID=A0A814S1J0_9BILA|nr:unnamed protein product [Adineta steineri]CAF1141945.1 unnamed protein product [Adineta steineri]